MSNEVQTRWQLSTSTSGSTQVFLSKNSFFGPSMNAFRQSGEQKLHHLHESVLQRDVKEAGEPASPKRPAVTGIRTVSTPLIYTHVLNRGVHGVDSPADRL
jgi:hypothetical protein